MPFLGPPSGSIIMAGRCWMKEDSWMSFYLGSRDAETMLIWVVRVIPSSPPS